jgi:Xaa-Pro aminopeptidase
MLEARAKICGRIAVEPCIRSGFRGSERMSDRPRGTRIGRLEPIQSALHGSGIGLLVLAVSDNMRYALGGYAPHGDERLCALLMTESDSAFVVSTVNADQARAHVQMPMFTHTDEGGPIRALTEALLALKSTDAATIAVDEEMRADHLLVLQSACSTATYRLAGDVVAPLRSRKDADEIAKLQAVSATADAGVEAVFAACKPGVTELELADIAAAAMRRAGAEESVFTHIGAAAHTALPHHASGSTALQAGDIVNIDIGGRLHGYCSDITRMAIVGGAPPDAEYARVHAVVEEGWRAAHAVARPGVRAREVDDAARKAIADAGYGEYFIHRTGHGLGLAIHEPPYITSTNDLVLEEGMVFSIEPGVYLPGRFGVRLEEIVYLTADGANVLSTLPRAVRFC